MDYYKAFPSFTGYRDIPSGSTIYKGYGQQSIGVIQQPMFFEDRMIEDMEYLQQMYPTYAKKYQSVIKSAVDKVDYESSFIYDQYPDKLSIQRMVSGVMEVIRRNEEKEALDADDARNGENDGITNNTADAALTERAPWSEKEPWIMELVTVVMYYDILGRRKRRQKNYWFV